MLGSALSAGGGGLSYGTATRLTLLGHGRDAGQTGRRCQTSAREHAGDKDDADFGWPDWSLVAADATVYEVG